MRKILWAAAITALCVLSLATDYASRDASAQVSVLPVKVSAVKPQDVVNLAGTLPPGMFNSPIASVPSDRFLVITDVWLESFKDSPATLSVQDSAGVRHQAITLACTQVGTNLEFTNCGPHEVLKTEYHSTVGLVVSPGDSIVISQNTFAPAPTGGVLAGGGTAALPPATGNPSCGANGVVHYVITGYLVRT